MNKNVEVLQKLKNKQSRAIILLLEGKSTEEVAKALEVAVNTVYRWLEKDEIFKKAFGEAREKIFNEALEDLKAGSRDAVKTLREIMNKGNKETARLGSAKTILELALKIKEINEFEKRILALEERLK